MGPPDNIPASELWALLQATPRPHRLVDFPRMGPGGEPLGQVAIWVLTQEEQMAANAEAEKFARRLLKDGKKGDLGYEALFDNEGAVQVLWRACRDPKDVKRPAFPSPGAMREAFTADEVGRLFEHYMTVQLEIGPIVAAMSADEYRAWVSRIAEAGSAFPLDLLSSDVRKTLVLFMASQLRNFWTGTSSAGSPPGPSAGSEALEYAPTEPPEPAVEDDASA